MIFTGQFEHAIDAKHRLAIPSKFRTRLDVAKDGAGLYIVPGIPSTRLWLYTERQFEAINQFVASELIPDEDQLRFEQEYFSQAELLEVDAQGRILIPERLMKKSKLPRDVMICGVRDHMEICPRSEFENETESGAERYREYQLKARRVYNEFQRRVGEKPDAT